MQGLSGNDNFSSKPLAERKGFNQIEHEDDGSLEMSNEGMDEGINKDRMHTSMREKSFVSGDPMSEVDKQTEEAAE